MRSAAVTVAVLLASTFTVAPVSAIPTDSKCVSVAEGERTRDGETRVHAERRYGAPGHPYHGRFELWAHGDRRYWRSYDKCTGADGIRLWVQYRTRSDRVTAWTWLYLEPDA